MGAPPQLRGLKGRWQERQVRRETREPSREVQGLLPQLLITPSFLHPWSGSPVRMSPSSLLAAGYKAYSHGGSSQQDVWTGWLGAWRAPPFGYTVCPHLGDFSSASERTSTIWG